MVAIGAVRSRRDALRPCTVVLPSIVAAFIAAFMILLALAIRDTNGVQRGKLILTLAAMNLLDPRLQRLVLPPVPSRPARRQNLLE